MKKVLEEFSKSIIWSFSRELVLLFFVAFITIIATVAGIIYSFINHIIYKVKVLFAVNTKLGKDGQVLRELAKYNCSGLKENLRFYNEVVEFRRMNKMDKTDFSDKVSLIMESIKKEKAREEEEIKRLLAICVKLGIANWRLKAVLPVKWANREAR